jgi:hypothetical protein
MTQSTDQQDAEPIYGPVREMPTDDAVHAMEASDGPGRPDDPAEADVPLLDGDLEQGIASIFAALHSATDGAQPTAEMSDQEADDVDVAKVDMSTFRLLGELDRLWHRA